MEPFVRGLTPDCLAYALQVARWTEAWVRNTSARFAWPGNTRQQIVDAASRDTQRHCSYCDQFLPDPSTIDHLRPKARYPGEAYRWANLYLCCQGCQHRKGLFDENVVAPDEPGYRFDDYFFVDTQWHLQPVNGPNAARASKTIEHFRLNDP